MGKKRSDEAAAAAVDTLPPLPGGTPGDGPPPPVEAQPAQAAAPVEAEKSGAEMQLARLLEVCAACKGERFTVQDGWAQWRQLRDRGQKVSPPPYPETRRCERCSGTGKMPTAEGREFVEVLKALMPYVR